MKTSNILRNTTICAVFIAMMIYSNQANAQSTTLTGVEISSAENSSGYNIVLNTDKDTNIEQKSDSKNNLVLDLKNTKIAEDSSTVYKDANGIDNVVFKPDANKNLQIEINGEDAANSKVKIADESAPVDYSNTVFINRPMKDYAPTQEIEETASDISVLSILRSIKNSPTLRSLLSPANMGWIMAFLLMFGMLIASQFKNNSQKSVNVKITDEEDKQNTTLRTALERKEGLIAEGLSSNRRNLIQPARTKLDNNVTSSKMNYGLKAYGNQNMSRNTFSVNAPKSQNVVAAATRQPMRTSVATKRELQEDIKKNEVQIDNIKFLESMAKIYERSGRVDLANGLANNIKKAKING